jgi:hypothetical protein
MLWLQSINAPSPWASNTIIAFLLYLRREFEWTKAEVTGRPKALCVFVFIYREQEMLVLIKQLTMKRFYLVILANHRNTKLLLPLFALRKLVLHRTDSWILFLLGMSYRLFKRFVLLLKLL